MTELKQCPFCGFHEVRTHCYDNPMYVSYHVYCLNCYSRGSPSKTKEDAYTSWNASY